MKKRPTGKLLGILAVLSFLIASIEGYIYYADYARFGLFRIVLTLQNSCKAFLFNPSLSAETVLGTLTGDISSFELYIGLAYVAAAFVAPLCTATALFVAAERILRNRLRSWRSLRREGILIFGYNESVKALLKNQSERPSGEKAPIIHVVADAALSDKEELALMKQNIFFSSMDCTRAPEKSMRELFASIHAQRIEKIFLLEDSSMRNVSLYMRLCALTGTKRMEERGVPAQISFPFAEKAACWCRCAESCARELIGDYYDVERPRLGLCLFDPEELRVRRALESNPPLPDLPAAWPPPEGSLDIHALIVGFGHTGEQMLRQIVNVGVAHSESRILIDVVDRQATCKKDFFLGTLQMEDRCLTPYGLRIGGNGTGRVSADGQLIIRFHDLDAQENNFVQLLRKAGAESPFTYAAVCIRDPDAALRCVSALERCTGSRGRIPIALDLEGSEQLAAYMNRNDSTYSNVFALGDGPVSLEDICLRRTEETARAYHELYRGIYFGPAGGASGSGKSWEELKLYQQQANRLLYDHSRTKEALLRAAAGSAEESPAAAQSLLREHLRRVGITAENGRFTYTAPGEEMLARLEQDPLLNELMRMEHRRWCYAMLFDGWSGACETKDELRRETPFLCDWAHLDPGVRMYDLIPTLMLACRTEEA